MIESETIIDVPWQKLDTIDPSTAKFPCRVRVDGEYILVFRLKDGFRGVQRSCPHMNMSLHDALIVSNESMIRCKQHVYTFRLSDGRGVNCPGFSIKVYEIKEEGGALYVRPHH